jgi:chemotaxis protein histidine kinase CheA
MKYLKTAFLNHWNLLIFLGGTAFALLSPFPDVALPLVAAAEISYLGLLGTHPKFQKYVDAQAAQAVREESSEAKQQTLDHIMKSLPKEILARFQTLRNQCMELRQIAMELKRPGIGAVDAPLDQFQVTGLDRLLWIHLRMLYTQFALSQFLKRTSAEQIQQGIGKLEQQIKQLPTDEGDPVRQRFRSALEDNLETSRSRLANLNKARENYQLFDVELDRLENKIRSLSEIAVNRQEPEYISSEVDHVASSMLDTEKTMNELQFATGLTPIDNEPPELLRTKAPVGISQGTGP